MNRYKFFAGLLLVVAWVLYACGSGGESDYPSVAGIYEITNGTDSIEISEEVTDYDISSAVFGVSQNGNAVTFLGCVGVLIGGTLSCEGTVEWEYSYGARLSDVYGSVSFEEVDGTMTMCTEDLVFSTSFVDVGMESTEKINFVARRIYE